MKEPGLMFAPLVRVSTERQERRGESLNTQRQQLETAIKTLNGKIFKWYCGQESASPDHERKILEKLMADAEAGRFDAVMAVDASRWSRDNQKSKTYLSILKKNKIQFYLLTKHMDLNEPFNNLILGLGVEINEFFASEQAYKSLLNKIGMAKKKIPSSGQHPYGRIYNKETKTWSINKDEQKIIVDIANRYLKGESFQSIRKLYKMNIPNLHKILKQRCGDSYDVHFKSERFNIDEIVGIKIPRLLPDNIIEKIKKKSGANLTYLHGQPSKNKYLLSRMIFCQECGLALSGETNKEGRRYYRHLPYSTCQNPLTNRVPANLIEDCVLGDIYKMFGDKPAIEKAAKAAIPDLVEKQEMQDSITRLEKELIKIDKSKERVFDMIEDGTINKTDVKKRMTALKEREALLSAELDKIKSELINIPTKADINKSAALLMRIKTNILKSEKHLSKMGWEDKRKLLQAVFAGKDSEDKRLGVYISRKKDRFVYSIHGILNQTLTDFVRDSSKEKITASDYLIEEDYIKEDLGRICSPHNRGRYDQ
jgi:DNA invertase Pin-like site-specific DNA recombinase